MVHSIFSSTTFVIGPITISSVLGAMEDVGEMIVMSLCAWYVVMLFRRERGEIVYKKRLAAALYDYQKTLNAFQ